jgi:NSS family neurotransmitter:Na+ symporter
MMIALLALMVILAINSFTLDGAKEGLAFYLKPDLSKITGNVIVGAMNQAFFTLSLGIGSMAIFGSYIGKERSLMGESLNILGLDTFVALMAGLIIFPACFTFDVEVGAGPSLLFQAMASVFNNMSGGRIWGSLFFLFMFFAAMSTIIAVFENILAMVREVTGWSRIKGCLICGAAVLILSLPCALGFNVLSGFVPFASGSGVLDLEDFLVSNCCLPLGALCYVLFCVSKKGWGFDNFLNEANAGKGLKMPRWLKPYLTYVLPLIIIVVFIMGIISFPFADNFTILDWIKGLF